MRKFIDTEYSPNPMGIYSAFYRDSLQGMIYIEARNERQVSHAISGLVGVFPSKGFTLVPIAEMTSLLKIKKIETTIAPGTWVRIKRGRYVGDLAQVLDVTDNGEEVGLKFIPRIDLTPKEGDALKRKRGAAQAASVVSRPPQRLFNVEEVSRIYGPRSCIRKKNDEFVFNGDTYKGGFLEKDFKIQGIATENVNPTLDEITAFRAGSDIDGEDGISGGVSNLDLSIIANAAKKAATAVLQPGDHVEVFEGEQVGLDGIVESIRDDIVILKPRLPDMEDQKIEITASSVRKRFKPGDHVKVMAGRNVDESGLVVAVNGDVISIWSDVSAQEVRTCERVPCSYFSLHSS
jgi:transcription elongation factor SPT5